jgi:hypothetical protein
MNFLRGNLAKEEGKKAASTCKLQKKKKSTHSLCFLFLTLASIVASGKHRFMGSAILS